MPFNMKENAFGLTQWHGNVAEATGEWRMNTEDYERIQGIVVDVRYLMYHYTGDHSKPQGILAQDIEEGAANPL